MSYSLSQNYPNPFNARTEIRFTVPDHGPVSVAIYDILGREVVVLVEGEAGIGKSRLVAEVRPNLEGATPGSRWLEGRGLSYGRSLSYHLPAGVLRHYLGLSDEDDETHVWLKLRAMGPDLFGARADEVLPYLAMLLGLRLPEAMAEKIPQADPQLLQQRVFFAFGEWVEAVSTQKHLVLAFDDELLTLYLREHGGKPLGILAS